tara:strand:+ start:709 stop:870 length:162 start_codon:yes stop_codon:yes gene_type:complete
MNTFKFPTDKYGLSVHNFNSNADFKKAKKAAANKLCAYKKKVAKYTLIGPVAL